MRGGCGGGDGGGRDERKDGAKSAIVTSGGSRT